MSYPSQITPAEAIEIIQSKATLLPSETVPLTEAYGRVLATDIMSKVNHPSLDNSALDGYACLLEDTLEAGDGNPVRLELLGEVPAGGLFKGRVNSGQCVAIYTGAPIPEGANAVIRIEGTSLEDKTVSVVEVADSSAVRKLGQDSPQYFCNVERMGFRSCLFTVISCSFFSELGSVSELRAMVEKLVKKIIKIKDFIFSYSLVDDDIHSSVLF